ncbi:MAG TPA: hypothetical protein VGD50_01990 [Candidatus Baltobacteraceae bacterium]
MNPIPALWYADRLAFVHSLRTIRKSPSRMLLYLCFAVFATLALVARALAVSLSGGRYHVHLGDVLQRDYVVCAYLIFFGATLAFGGPSIALFKSAVEGRFVIGAPVDPRIAVAYLQLRASLMNSFRYLFAFAYWTLFGANYRFFVGTWQLVGDLALMLLSGVALLCVSIPRRLAPPPAAVACIVAGVIVIALAIAIALRDAAYQLHWPTIYAPLKALLPSVFPGLVLIRPNAVWITLVAGVICLAVLAQASMSRRKLPELYALSMAAVEKVQRLIDRQRGRAASTQTTQTHKRSALRSIDMPGGVLALAWVSLIATLRVGSRALRALVVVALLTSGFVAARNPILQAGVASLVIVFVILRNVITPLALKQQLCRPIIWLSRASLFERLCAVALGQIVLPSAAVGVFALGYTAGGGEAGAAIFIVVAGVQLLTLLTAGDFALFALFPSALDQRGAVRAFSLLLLTLFIVPPAIAYAVAFVLLHSAAGALACAIPFVLGESALLLALAAARLNGRTDLLVV